MMVGFKVSVRSALLLGAATLSHPAFAQVGAQAVGAAPEAQLGDIVVTAQKRSESIQNVPISITAISARDIQDRNIRDLHDLASIAPSLSIQENINGRSTIVIRGLSTGSVPSDKPTVGETVGVYFDDIPVSLALRSPDLRPVDLERIEVLRGPQGTLYGGGALGGAVKYVGVAPNFEKVELGVDADLNTTHHGGFGNNVDAIVNIPIVTDRLAFRVAGYNSFEPGYIRNVITGEQHAGDTKVRGFRAQLAAKLGERLELVGKIIFQNSDFGPGTATVDTDVPSQPAGSLHGLEQAVPTVEHGSDRFRLYNLTGTLDLGFAELYSSTSRIVRSSSSTSDLSYLLQSVFLDPRLLSQAIETVPVRQWMQEVRLTSTGKGPFRWVLGGFYSDSNRAYIADGPTPGFAAVTGLDSRDYGGFGPDNVYSSRSPVYEKQRALFGEASYDIGRFTLTTGARLFRQQQTYDLFAVGVLNAGITSGEARSKGSGVNPRFIASYQASSNIKISAQAAKGFRLGGGNDTVPASACAADFANLGLTSTPGSFGQESVWSYELNAKMRLADGRITFNPAIFRTDYKDIQVVQTLPLCGYTFIANAGKARTQGVEFDTSIRVTHNLTVRGGMSYTDAKLTSALPPGVAGQDGDRLPLSPRWTANAVVRYEHDVADWRAFGQTDIRYQSNVVQELASNVDPVDARTIVGLRIGARRNQVEASLYADNVFDNRARTSASFIPARGYLYTVERPRQIGVTVGFRY